MSQYTAGENVTAAAVVITSNPRAFLAINLTKHKELLLQPKDWAQITQKLDAVRTPPQKDFTSS